MAFGFSGCRSIGIGLVLVSQSSENDITIQDGRRAHMGGGGGRGCMRVRNIWGRRSGLVVWGLGGEGAPEGGAASCRGGVACVRRDRHARDRGGSRGGRAAGLKSGFGGLGKMEFGPLFKIEPNAIGNLHRPIQYQFPNLALFVPLTLIFWDPALALHVRDDHKTRLTRHWVAAKILYQN